MSVFSNLVQWMDRRGDLLSISGRFYAFGPLLLTAALLTFLDQEVPVPAIFWIAAVLCLVGCGVYYLAFIKALAAQRERFYQREVKPILSREYRDE